MRNTVHLFVKKCLAESGFTGAPSETDRNQHPTADIIFVNDSGAVLGIQFPCPRDEPYQFDPYFEGRGGWAWV